MKFCGFLMFVDFARCTCVWTHQKCPFTIRVAYLCTTKQVIKIVNCTFPSLSIFSFLKRKSKKKSPNRILSFRTENIPPPKKKKKKLAIFNPLGKIFQQKRYLKKKQVVYECLMLIQQLLVSNVSDTS